MGAKGEESCAGFDVPYLVIFRAPYIFSRNNPPWTDGSMILRMAGRTRPENSSTLL